MCGRMNFTLLIPGQAFHKPAQESSRPVKSVSQTVYAGTLAQDGAAINGGQVLTFAWAGVAHGHPLSFGNACMSEKLCCHRLLCKLVRLLKHYAFMLAWSLWLAAWGEVLETWTLSFWTSCLGSCSSIT